MEQTISILQVKCIKNSNGVISGIRWTPFSNTRNIIKRHYHLGGQTVVKFNRIPPKSNNSHVLVVRPKKFGYFNFTSAEVRYKSGEEDGATKIGFSSDPGQGLITALKDYERQFSAHMVSVQLHK